MWSMKKENKMLTRSHQRTELMLVFQYKNGRKWIRNKRGKEIHKNRGRRPVRVKLGKKETKTGEGESFIY